MSLVNTKSMLAKLLASENITVEHGNYETASSSQTSDLERDERFLV